MVSSSGGDQQTWVTDAVRAARLYYHAGLTQEEVGRRLGLTRWKVNRLLAQARESGIVRIEIVPPKGGLFRELEEQLVDRYPLRDCVVVPPMGDDQADLDEVGRAAASYLTNLRTPPGSIAVSWGQTMGAMAENIPDGWADGVEVVLANGGLSRSYAPTGAAGIAERLAEAGSGTADLVPGPAISELASTRELLEADRAVAQVLEAARAAPIAIFGLGALTRDSVLVRSDYLEPEEIDHLEARGAVGDVLGRFIGRDGQIVDSELDARTLGLTRSDLQAKELSIGVAAGPSKAAISAAAVIGGWVTTLITDANTARALLSESNEEATA